MLSPDAIMVQAMITADTTLVVSKDQISCDVAGEATILNLKNGVYYGLNAMGARIWALIQEPRTLAEIRDTLLSEFEVDAPRLEADLHKLMAELAEHQLIEVSE